MFSTRRVGISLARPFNRGPRAEWRGREKANEIFVSRSDGCNRCEFQSLLCDENPWPAGRHGLEKGNNIVDSDE